ncbi:MAG: VOC family protein [Gammaproteobacteria bacterium]|nr:VOC family protein [Gammaproteobacteria bacterium]
MIRVRAIDHIVLRTAHLADMVDFYSRVLGCTVERTLPEEVGLYQLRAGSALIDIVAVDSELGRHGGGPPTATQNNLDHFCLQIDSFEEQALLDWLSQQGIEASEFELRYGAQGFGPSVYIRDPDGNTIELKAINKGDKQRR